MQADLIRSFVRSLDTTSSTAEEAAWSELKPLGESVVPYLAEFYPHAHKWQGRVSLIFHSIRYARTSPVAFHLALRALEDRSTLVRYRACALLAYSLRRDALPSLAKLLSHKDARTRADAHAAIDAIEQQNHHFFIDRRHSGRTQWIVNDEDRAG